MEIFYLHQELLNTIRRRQPRADPRAGCCGSRGRKAPGDSISGAISLALTKACPITTRRALATPTVAARDLAAIRVCCVAASGTRVYLCTVSARFRYTGTWGGSRWISSLSY